MKYNVYANSVKTKLFLFVIIFALLVSTVSVSFASAVSYTGSSNYMSGKYYTALKNVTLTGNQRTDIINVAKSQIGYFEGNSKSQLAGTVNGSGNYTEYGRWYETVCGSSGFINAAWCAMFVSWCAYVAGISDSIVPCHAWTVEGLKKFISNGQAYTRANVAAGKYVPQAGDIIYYKSSSTSNITNHVGIVTGYSNGTVYTIEGNTSSTTISTNGGTCAAKSYSISNTFIVYICKPAYNSEISSSTYKVTSSDALNLRSGPSTSYDILTSIPSNALIDITQVSGNWGKTTYNGQTGWISTKYAEFVSATKISSHLDAPLSLSGDAAKLLEGSVEWEKGSEYSLDGWALHTAGVKSAEYKFESQSSWTALTTSTRSDVQSSVSGFLDYSNCGFKGKINVDSLSVGAHTLSVRISTQAGVYHTIAKLTVNVTEDSGFKLISTATLSVDRENGYLKNVSEKSTCNELTAQFESTVTVKDTSGNTVNSESIICTGYSVVSSKGTSVEIVIKGDINGDGAVTVADYSMFRSYLKNSVTISENAKIEAADTTSDGKLTSTDYLYIKRHCAGTFDLFS